MDRDSAIAKITKCLALSRSANPHEAAAALRQAQKLMQQHDVDELQIEMASVREAAAPARSAAVLLWEVNLAHAVAEAFGCQFLMQRGLQITFAAHRRRTRFVFVGVAASAEVAAYAHNALAARCAKARLAHIATQPRQCKPITKTARGDAFALAWVYGVQAMLDRFANGDRHKPLLDAYIASRFPEVTEIKPRSREVGRNVKPDSYALGLREGTKVELERGVGHVPAMEKLS